MNKTAQKIDVDKVLNTIDNTLREIKEGIQSPELTKADRKELAKGFDELIIYGYKLKISSKIKTLFDECPTTSTRDMLTIILPEISNKIEGKVLAELTGYAISEWEKRKLKIAA